MKTADSSVNDGKEELCSFISNFEVSDESIQFVYNEHEIKGEKLY